MNVRQRSSVTLVLSCIGSFATAGPVLAAAGDLDKTFSGDGIVTSKLGTDRAVVVQPNGRIVVGGKRTAKQRETFSLARYRGNGTLDPSFSADGKVTTRFANRQCVGIDALSMAPGKKIVAAGRTGCVGGKFAIARYLPSGKLDLTFSSDGRTTTSFGTDCRFAEPGGVAVASNGRIVVAGRVQCTVGGVPISTFALARYKRNGQLDKTFSTDGRVTTDITHTADYAYDVVLAPGGRIVVAGTTDGESFEHSHFALARYLADGSLDAAFGDAGIVTTAFTGEGTCEEWAQAYALARQSNGRLVVGGKTGCAGHPNFALARYRSDGTLDPTFGGDGRVATRVTPDGCSEIVNDIAIRSGGRIIAAGAAGCQDPHARFALARYRPSGALDTGFGGDGTVTATLRKTGDCFDELKAVGLHAGKIVAAGFSGCAPGGASALLRFSGG